MATTSSAALDLSALERPVLTDCAKIYIDLGLTSGSTLKDSSSPNAFGDALSPCRMRSMDLLFGNRNS